MDLQKSGIRTVFTLGKEIENLFFIPPVIAALLQPAERKQWSMVWEALFRENRYDAFGSFQTLHQAHLEPKVDAKTVTKQFGPIFDSMWDSTKLRHNVIGGKVALKKLREFYSATRFHHNLPDNVLMTW